MYLNENALAATFNKNEQLDMHNLVSGLLGDVFALTEDQSNIQHKDNRLYGLSQLFQSSKAIVRGMWGFNKQEMIHHYMSKCMIIGGMKG